MFRLVPEAKKSSICCVQKLVALKGREGDGTHFGSRGSFIKLTVIE
jgi:hypothetical protein